MLIKDSLFQHELTVDLCKQGNMNLFISSTWTVRSLLRCTWHTLSCWHVIVFCRVLSCFIVLNNLFWQRARIMLIGSKWIDFQKSVLHSTKSMQNWSKTFQSWDIYLINYFKSTSPYQMAHSMGLIHLERKIITQGYNPHKCPSAL